MIMLACLNIKNLLLLSNAMLLLIKKPFSGSNFYPSLGAYSSSDLMIQKIHFSWLKKAKIGNFYFLLLFLLTY